jgi:hypothetical protein
MFESHQLLSSNTVDWAAHVGGLAAGLLVGLGLFSCSMELMGCRILWFLVGMAVAGAAFAGALIYMYSGAVNPAEELRDVCGYYQQFFAEYQCKCQRGGGQ